MGDLGDFFKEAFKIVLALAFPELAILVGILKKMGIIDTNEDPLVVGDKMLQAEDDGIVLDDFENYDDYFKEIKDHPLDPEKSAENSEEKRFQKYAANMLVVAGKEYGDDFIPFMTEVGTKLSPQFGLDEKMNDYLDSFKGDLNSLNGYFKGALEKSTDMPEMESRIVALEKNLNPDKSDDQIKNELREERKSLND